MSQESKKNNEQNFDWSSPFVACLYLYDFGGEIIFASNHNDRITPLFAKEFVTKSSFSDVFYFDDIQKELNNSFEEIAGYSKGKKVFFFITIGVQSIYATLTQMSHIFTDKESQDQLSKIFKKEILWNEQKKIRKHCLF